MPTIEELRVQFRKKFASVPVPLRDEIIAVADGQTLTWATAYLEIDAGTRLGDKILSALEQLKILGGEQNGV